MKRFLLAPLAVLLLISTSCGRDELSRQCSSASDCGTGQVCESGFCTDGPDLNSWNATNNQNATNNTNSTNGVQNSVNNITCQSNTDCPDGEVCDLMANQCIPGVCVENADGNCVTEDSQTPCDIGCADFEEQSGCGCVAVDCQTDADCGDYLCIEGTCAACTDSAQCADGELCDDGRCVKDTSCRTDEDCDPEQECRGGMCLDRPECLLDRDCDDDELCLGGNCIYSPQCEEDNDCGEGFECIGGNCFEALCRGPEDCEAGLICDAGECIDPPPAVSCFIATPDGVILPGQTIPLEAFALDGNGVGVAATFNWTSSAPAVANVDGSGRNAVGGTTAGSASFTATLAGGDPVQCEGAADLTNPGVATMGGLRVTVVNGENGGAVPGATVQVGNTTVQTDAAGIASLTLPNAAFDVTVRHQDFNWLTVQGINTNDIRLSVLPKSGSGPVGGFSGEFDLSAVGSSGEVNVGLAGASITGGLLELDLTRILGEPFLTQFSIPGGGTQEFPIPGGLIAYGGAFGFNVDIKRDYYAATTGGAKLAWGLAGKVPFRELIALGQGGVEGSDVLTTILPLFNRFDHTSQPINVAALPRVPDAMDVDGDGDRSEMVPDYQAFPTVNLRPSVSQTLATDVDVSNFPTLPGGQGELALLMGGTLLNAPGLVPLGISATNDEDGDGRPDTRRLSIAPPSGSIAGGRYALVAIAFRTDGFGGSFNFPPNLSAALWNGQSFPSSISLGTFPDASTAQIDQNQRTIAIQADAGPLYRVRLVGADRSWDVWSHGSPGVMGAFSHTVNVPAAPTAQSDFFTNGDVILDAIQTSVTLETLVRANGVGLTNVGLVSTAFNRTQIQ